MQPEAVLLFSQNFLDFVALPAWIYCKQTGNVQTLQN